MKLVVAASDKQIQATENTQQIIQLEPYRKPLSTRHIPPEILAEIFQFSATLDEYNFVRVCHYWYDVARDTPELWRYWGGSLRDWKRASIYSRTHVAIDLVLDRFEEEDLKFFDLNLRNALRDHAGANAIQKIHLINKNEELMSSILSLLTPEGNVVRHSSIKSIYLGGSVDPSEFFARNHFQQLQKLSLDHTGLALAHLKATTLVNLSLANTSDCKSPTSQIISLLASNRNIRTLKLSLFVPGNCNKPEATRQVALPHLEELYLEGKPHHVLQFWSQLEFSAMVKKATFSLVDCRLKTINMQSIQPYLCGVLQHYAKVGAGLKVSIDSSDKDGDVALCVSGTGTGTGGPEMDIFLFNKKGTQMKLFYTKILRLLPKERIADFETDSLEIEEMPNLRCLRLLMVVVSDGFLLPRPDGPNAHTKLFPLLQELHLTDVTAKDNNWDPLIHYLEHQSISLHVEGHICLEVRMKIEPLVAELTYIPEQEYGCDICGHCQGHSLVPTSN